MERRHVGMGCMRLSTDPVERELAQRTLRAAVEAGVTLLDTAAAYGPGAKGKHANEALLAETLALDELTVVTKCGMARPHGGWQPDGRRKTILADAAGSAQALGRPADVLLLHAPDPRSSFETSLRALVAARDAGYARALGLSNVRVGHLERALDHFEPAMVQVALSPQDASAARSGVVDWCRARNIPVLAHSPLGGPKRWRALGKDEELLWLAEQHEVTPQTLALAWLYGLDPALVPLPGARRPETAAAAGAAAKLVLRDDERALLDERFALGRLVRVPLAERVVRSPRQQVIVFVGIPGAGKSTAARRFTEDGALRLSRDERGGTLADLAESMRGELLEGADRILLDATYPTRAQRSVALEAAWEAGASARAVVFDTPPAEAAINVIDRMLAANGGVLPGPKEIAKLARKDARFVPPAAQRRFSSTFEPPTEAEGFVEVEQVVFERRPRPEDVKAGVAVALDAVLDEGAFAARRLQELASLEHPVLLFGWARSIARAESLSHAFDALSLPPTIGLALCPHEGGPQRCWCRPPAPGLLLEWMRGAHIAPAKLVVYGARELAESIGAQAQPASALQNS